MVLVESMDCVVPLQSEFDRNSPNTSHLSTPTVTVNKQDYTNGMNPYLPTMVPSTYNNYNDNGTSMSSIVEMKKTDQPNLTYDAKGNCLRC